MSTRGIRNNNWGNIERGANWKGIDPDGNDTRFATFLDPIYGLRAIIKITINYKQRHKISTINQWVNRWAPAHENDTKVYRAYLETQTGAKRLNVDDKEFMKKFVKAVCKMECGRNEIQKLWKDWYFERAWSERNK